MEYKERKKFYYRILWSTLNYRIIYWSWLAASLLSLKVSFIINNVTFFSFQRDKRLSQQSLVKEETIGGSGSSLAEGASSKSIICRFFWAPTKDARFFFLPLFSVGLHSGPASHILAWASMVINAPRDTTSFISSL